MREVAVIVSSAIFGLIFGLGLIAAQVTDPDVICDFLDITGDWNPAVALVMLAAIVVAAPAFFLARRSRHPLLGDRFYLPENRLRLDNPLLLGAGIFGVGWGLAGICPGPGLVLLGTLDRGALIFIAFVIVGAILGRLAHPHLSGSEERP